MANSLSMCGSAAIAICLILAGPVDAAVAPPLALEATIALPQTSGRIDHMDIDRARHRLFVAEHDNGTLDVVDLVRHRVIKRIVGLEKPQGVVFSPRADVLAVDCGGDGTVRLYSGATYAPRGVIRLGVDADDARLDTDGDFVVAYGARGDAGLAVIDPAKAEVIKRIPLPAHPEGFQISGDRAFANVPDAGQIDEVSLESGKRIAKWVLPHGLASNYPMALGDNGRIALGFRRPDALALFDSTDGRVVARVAACGDADDIWFDAKNRRYYMSCGAGRIDAFAVVDGALRSEGDVATSWNDRTSLFVPELNRLFLAVRATPPGDTAAIRIYRPRP